MTKWMLITGCLLWLLIAVGALARSQDVTTLPPPAKPITIVPQEGFNLTVVDQINPHYVIVKVSPPIHNWFAGTFTNLPTDKEVTIGLSMEGMDTPGNKANVAKWQGLMPVMTYADPTKYESYEWFQKDKDGRWVSGDPFKQGEAKFAGTGKVPKQTVISADVAEQFLSEDGTYWQPWRDVDCAEAVTSVNIFRVKQHFKYPTATVAMRVPYLPIYYTAFWHRLEGVKFHGVTVHHIGKSEQKRDLSVIEITDPDAKADTKNRPVVMLYGAEDGDEPDGAWLVHGAVQWLISDDPKAAALRKQVTFLCIPLVDPDGAAQCAYATLTYSFAMKKADAPMRPEVLAYTKFVTAWMASGRRLDLVCNYHNIECSEAPNVLCPIIDLRRAEAMTALNTFILARLPGVQTSPQTWMTGYADDRFMGWCSKHWGSLQIAYEINSRYPNNHLSLMQLQELGASYARAYGEYIQSDLFKAVLPDIERVRRQHLQERQRFWAQRDDPDEPRTAYEIVTLGF